jgi:hypothetical protein
LKGILCADPGKIPRVSPKADEEGFNDAQYLSMN